MLFVLKSNNTVVKCTKCYIKYYVYIYIYMTTGVIYAIDVYAKLFCDLNGCTFIFISGANTNKLSRTKLILKNVLYLFEQVIYSFIFLLLHVFIYYFCRLGPQFIISRSDFIIKPIICLSLKIIMNKGPSMNIAVYKQCMLMSEHKNIHLFDFRSTAGLLVCQQLACILSICFTVKFYGFKKQSIQILQADFFFFKHFA